jgi:hypothetical protein
MSETTVMMVRGKVREETAPEVEEKVRKMFAAINAARPEGVRYASCALPDGQTFVALLALDDPGENPLVALPEFRAFQEALKDWLVEPPAPEQLRVVGSYNLF